MLNRDRSWLTRHRTVTYGVTAVLDFALAWAYMYRPGTPRVMSATLLPLSVGDGVYGGVEKVTDEKLEEGEEEEVPELVVVEV